MERLKSTGEMKEILGPTLLITADSVAVYEGVIREKPSGKEEARMFIKGLLISPLYQIIVCE
nr:maf-like protein DDB_G0281937 isoform X2 [Ipomoea batatas]